MNEVVDSNDVQMRQFQATLSYLIFCRAPLLFVFLPDQVAAAAEPLRPIAAAAPDLLPNTLLRYVPKLVERTPAQC